MTDRRPTEEPTPSIRPGQRPAADDPDTWAHMRQRLLASSKTAYANPRDTGAVIEFTSTLAFSGLPDAFLSSLGRELRLAELLVAQLPPEKGRALCAQLTQQALQAGPHACRGLAHLFVGVLATTTRLCSLPRGHAPALSALSALAESVNTLRKALPHDESLHLKQRVKATLSAS